VTARLTTIVFDAHEPQNLAAFWAAVLGWVANEPETDGSVAVVPTDDIESHILLFSPTVDAKVTKNRVHLDVNPVEVDQAAELERLVDLGAVAIDIGQGEQTWHVLADPEGNEFCLLRRTVRA